MLLIDKISIALLMGLAWPLWSQGGPVAPVGAATPASSPLEQLNGLFRAAYRQAKADCLVRGGPVLVVDGDRLLLFRNDLEVARESIRPGSYHRLKAVAHVPLALLLVLSGPGRGPWSPERMAELGAMRDLTAKARQDLQADFPTADRPRQEQILDACLRLLDGCLRDGTVSPEPLAAFTRDMGPLVMANADEAAGQELEQLDRAVSRFRQRLGAGAWNGVRVVIIGSHMAREGEVSLQYFSRLLDEPGEGGRIVYAEGLWQPRDALALLATHQVDTSAGAAFFADPRRMHRDLLADGATRWLDRHPLHP